MSCKCPSCSLMRSVKLCVHAGIQKLWRMSPIGYLKSRFFWGFPPIHRNAVDMTTNRESDSCWEFIIVHSCKDAIYSFLSFIPRKIHYTVSALCVCYNWRYRRCHYSLCAVFPVLLGASTPNQLCMMSQLPLFPLIWSIVVYWNYSSPSNINCMVKHNAQHCIYVPLSLVS